LLAIATIFVVTGAALDLHDELGADHAGPVLSYPLSILLERSEPSLLVLFVRTKWPS
jgi:hypothetical protein